MCSSIATCCSTVVGAEAGPGPGTQNNKRNIFIYLPTRPLKCRVIHCKTAQVFRVLAILWFLHTRPVSCSLATRAIAQGGACMRTTGLSSLSFGGIWVDDALLSIVLLDALSEAPAEGSMPLSPVKGAHGRVSGIFHGTLAQAELVLLTRTAAPSTTCALAIVSRNPLLRQGR